MSDQQLLRICQKTNSTRILLIIIDGLGGMPHPDFDKKSELEYAQLPNLDALARREESVLGTLYPVARGFVPGSAAGHFGLLGYDPLLRENHVGRGVLEALDLDLSIDPGDVVARLNFATIVNGVVADRRAGRMADATHLAAQLNAGLAVKGAEAKVVATREYRGVLLLRHRGHPLSTEVTGTDPREDGKPIERCFANNAVDQGAQRTAQIINSISDQALDILGTSSPANGILLRGFSARPNIPTLSELHGLDAFAIADFPLYRGIAKLLGMTVGEPCRSLKDKVRQLKEQYDSFTFFFMHYKDPDVMGEDGDFLGKVRALEAFDAVVPSILETMDLRSDVIAITGDHSTPALLHGHSHHAVPLLVFSALNRAGDRVQRFTERECAYGTFGSPRGSELMGSLLAAAQKVAKFDL